MEKHTPVLLKEVLYFLDVRPGRRFIDATVGGSGHTKAILNLGGEVLGIDASPVALRLAEEELKEETRFRLVRGNFADIGRIAKQEGFGRVDGILFDLGIASFQLDNPSLGLSFRSEGPLDMRIDPSLGVCASDLINALPERELYELFSQVGQEKRALEIARAVVSARSVKPFETTTDLRRVVEEVYGRREKVKGPGTIRYGAGKRQKIHPATKVFMALRIAVNLEFENLVRALPQTLELLKPRGRLAVISFHSGEDRIVKHFLREEEKKGTVKVITKKPVVPSETEAQENPRARSAKMRAAEKL